MAVGATTAAVPEPEPRHESDLYTRPGWVDADVALAQLDQEKANGDRSILWVRSKIQKQLKSLGKVLEFHAGKFLFVCILAIVTFSVGLKSVTLHTDIELLWAESPGTPETSPKELLSTHQMVVQTGIDADVDLLNSHSLLEHLQLVKKTTEITVNMFDITWKLKDFCQFPSIPNIDAQYIEAIFDNMMPCSISTPLDCFWEGSKLLGPDHPVHIPYGVGDQIKWTNLNPKALIERMKKRESTFDYHSLEDYLKRAGVTTAYQEKPCLNANDPECPTTSPNFNSTKALDIGAELTGGCYGFASKFMHWPEELIVGGVKKNKTGHIKGARALQTVIQLMGENELYEFWSGHYKVHHIGWNQEKASLVLNAWQTKFAQEVKRLSEVKRSSSSPYSYLTFSTANVNKILKEYSKIDPIKIGVVVAAIAVYSWMVQSLLAAVGTIVITSTTTAALGVCSLIGLPMNLLTTHVLPFISVGLAMREMFLFLNLHIKNLPPPEILLRTGPTIVATFIMNSATFLIAAILPVPALRVFALQSTIMTIFHGASFLIVFPCLLALQERCERSDVPCFRNETNGKSKKSTSHNKNKNNNAQEHDANLLTTELVCQKNKNIVSYFITRYFKSVLMNPFVKVVMCIVYAILVIFFIFSYLRSKFDVRLSSFLPTNTQEYKYLETQNSFFGFYHFYMVTTDLEYPFNQPLLYEFHSDFSHVPYVLKDLNGELNMNDFWLANFKDYLADLQDEFDHNRNSYCLNSEKWYSNVTEKAVLAFKLMAQTGIVEFPVDKSQILKKRLVNEGIIDPKAFYNYLSVWNSNDQISYSSSQANLTPKPFQYYTSKAEPDLKIPRSQPLNYAQIPFYLRNLKSTNDIITTLKHIKQISEEFNKKGLRNYPVGLIFAYFNQFLLLDRVLIIQLLSTLGVAGIVMCFFVSWSKLGCALFGILGAILPLSLVNINAFSGTMGALHFIIVGRNICLLTTSFFSSIGNRERRVKMALEINSDAIIKGDLGLFVSVAVLMLSDFEFIREQIFIGLIISVVSSLINSLVFYPIILVIIGAKAEIVPFEHDDRISTPPPPTPPPPPERPKPFPKMSSRRNPLTKPIRESSLTTITEESCNQSIVVEPQVTVEYSSPDSTSSGPYTTKVTATANIKVEVVTPMYRSTKCGTCHAKQCNRNKQKTSSSAHCKFCNKDSDSDSTTETEPCQSS